ncbi:MAG: MBL fold metallo-hydrolase [Euryarchaeota archaeon]|nr:MBL fold metallo-hydrolase [Euryarchaeota archaeon]MDE1836814.1 MBL fold metallo-hydrolase [Euryarchaeota archaeon]MDE1881717.1 MBL fold metallo-hydrolase [Euryarchaeota archaeon]MDE2044798.1 MBL fold metallo-hydrolase [Thermoplasmata archaeon]
MRSVHYDFETLTEGAIFAHARSSGGALSNSTLVDLGSEVLVFDTSLTPFAAEDLVRATVEATGRHPTLAANSHWHLDHLLGNQVFASLPRYSTTGTQRILTERRETLASEISVESLQKDVQGLEEMVRSAPTKDAKAYLGGVLELNRWVLRAAPNLHLTVPNRTFRDRLTLPGQRRAQLLSFGSGHTESDALLHLPEDRVVCAGDLVVGGTHPNLTSGDPEHWLKVLKEIEHLRPERVVPGHGPIGTGESITTMQDYLETILALPLPSRRVPRVPTRFRAWKEPGQFEENVKFLRTRAQREIG